MNGSEIVTPTDHGLSALARTLVVAVVVSTSIGAAGLAAAQPTGDAPQERVADDRADAPALEAGEATDAGERTRPVAQSNESEPVSLSVEDVSDCGSRCRHVTANLTNTGNEGLENVTAETQIFADDARVWERTHRFGDLPANASADRTVQIRLGVVDAFVVARNDGWVTINTTVRWDGGNATFTERHRVFR